MQNDLTPRQLAGAANGRLAAGAKSPEGLARSAANSTKHGLSSKSAAKPPVILFNESPDAYTAIIEALIACFQPGDQHELILVHRMAEAEWLRHRALHMESAAMAEAMRQQARPFTDNAGTTKLSSSDTEALRAWHAFSKLTSANPAFAALQRYATTHARAYSRAERELRDYRIAKAESIHPTPEPIDPPVTLEPCSQPHEQPQQRWQPVASIPQPNTDPTDCAPIMEQEATPPPPRETTQTTCYETKVTGPSSATTSDQEEALPGLFPIS